MELLVVGYDNTFGCDGVALSISDYRDFGAQLGIEVAEACGGRDQQLSHQESHRGRRGGESK